MVSTYLIEVNINAFMFVWIISHQTALYMKQLQKHYIYLRRLMESIIHLHVL